MKEIPLGVRGRRHLLVTPETAIDFLGDERARVLSTPHLIAYMEWAARDALLPYLDENEDSLGTMVHVRHLAATPVGMSVEFTATVTGVEGRRVTFRVEARDEMELVGEGTHERFVADIPKLVSRLAAKRPR
ncbi:MAG: thioesterase family protein [Bryobacteraceae bacterium]